MKKYSVLVVASALAIVCVVAVIVTKFHNTSYPSFNEANDRTASTGQTQADFKTEGFTVYDDETQTEFKIDNWLSNITNDYEPSRSTQTSNSEDRTNAVEKTAQTVSQKVTEKATQISTGVSQVVSTLNSAFNDVFKMPKAPKYIPKYTETGIDFGKASLASYMYDPEGGYYYTNDKDCWQKNFGYNQVYDSLAVVGQMYYDTVRTTFNYGGKDWLIQIWKGQYGYYFVGGEVGVYTKRQGSASSTYVCADKEDWLNMEMAFVWDENKTGDYKTIFTRPYDKYWWCTGFVIGFPSKSIVNSRKEFRLIVHITFKDETMAKAFCSAFENNGFRRVDILDNNNDIDSFVQVGADVAFVWQNINQNVI